MYGAALRIILLNKGKRRHQPLGQASKRRNIVSSKQLYLITLVSVVQRYFGWLVVIVLDSRGLAAAKMKFCNVVRDGGGSSASSRLFGHRIFSKSLSEAVFLVCPIAHGRDETPGVVFSRYSKAVS
jgi:hypothetical protein